jgi:serine/threonine protein kinase/WD40 repeat protein
MNTPETESARWKQLDQLLDELLDVPREQRTAFLDQACAGDEALRKEIDQLLVFADRAQSFIEAPAFQASNPNMDSANLSTLLAGTAPREPLLRTGKLIAGRYAILSRLGKGGMGEVWHAYDVKLRVDVALKSLRHDFAGGQDPLELIRREVRIAREVISPNVCRIFDLVSEQDYELISMEHIDGITLMEMMEEKGPLPLRDARDIAAQFLAGLDAIHSAGLVHRDLKPENIMITRTGRVVVMDLGIAQPQSQVGIVSGTLPYMSPEQIAGEPVDARSDIFSAGVVLAEMIYTRGTESANTREQIWQAIRKDPMQLPDSGWKEIVTKAVSIKKEDRFESAVALSHALEEITSRSETVENKTPYPGLFSFSESDSEFFFGREQEVETLIKKIQLLHMMALIGPSGAGKTSFLQAGLIPALPENWGYALMHPGGAPMANLQQAVAAMLTDDEEGIARIDNFEEPDTAIWILNRIRRAQTEFLLIIDRFEELFTLSSAEAQSRFTEFLGRATLEANVRVLLAMRDDFFLFCNEHPSLSPIFSEPTPMSPLSGASLRRALVQPALKCGYKFEDESLVHDILSDVEKERGALPLLAFAASLLWEKRDRGKGQLTRKAYEEIGGVHGALAQHAENTMQRIGIEKESIVREIFRNLITAQNTRVARETDELLSVFSPLMKGGVRQGQPPPSLPLDKGEEFARQARFDKGEEFARQSRFDKGEESAAQVLRILVNARLLTSFENRVEITHESLINNWPRLVKWRAQDAESAQMRDELRQAAQLWNQKGRPAYLLWTGTAFLEFQLWRQRYPGGLTATENAFAEAMTQSANRKRKQRRILVSTVIVLLLTIVTVIGKLWRSAKVEADLAEARQLLATGRSLPETDRKTKLAYAIASLETADTPDARRLATQILSEGPPPFVFLKKVSYPSVLFSPDDNWLAVNESGQLKLFSHDGSQVVSVTNDIAGPFQFTRDGKFLVWVSFKDARKLELWSIQEKRIARTYTQPGITKLLRQNGKDVFFVTDTTGRKTLDKSRWTEIDFGVFKSVDQPLNILGHFSNGTGGWMDVSNDGHLVLAKATSDDVFLRNVLAPEMGTEKLLFPISGHLFTISFDPTGKFIAASRHEGDTSIYSIDPLNAKPVRTLSGTGVLSFDSTGRYLAAASDKLFLWDLKASNEAAPVVIQHPFNEEVYAVSFDHHGRWMAVAWENSIEFYPLTNVHPFLFNGGGVTNDIRFTPDGKSILGGFTNQGVVEWSVPGEVQKSRRSLWKFSSPGGFDVYFDLDPSGKHVIVTPGYADGAPFLISTTDGQSRSLANKLPTRTNHRLSFSPDGKFAAGVSLFAEQPTEFTGIEIWNLETGEEKMLEPSRGIGSLAVQYAPDGSLFSGDTSGNLHHWNLKDQSHKVWKIGEGIVTSIAVTKDGRYVSVVATSAKKYEDIPASTSEMAVIDLQTDQLERIHSHGHRLYRVTFDPTGTKLVTGDVDGVVRVGSIDGKTPNELFGHQSQISEVTVDPSGNWIASAEMNRPVVRLWPMPKGQPLQTLPHDELLRKLRGLTNVRVVQDQSASNGYRVEIEPFHRW